MESVFVRGFSRDEHAWLWQPDARSFKRTNGSLPHEVTRGKYFFFKYKSCTRWWVTCWREFISTLWLTIYPALQITLGRATKDKPIDVDLSLEGPAWKISRKQGEYSGILWNAVEQIKRICYKKRKVIKPCSSAFLDIIFDILSWFFHFSCAISRYLTCTAGVYPAL